MSERPTVTVEPCTANTIWIKVKDGPHILVGATDVRVIANGANIEVVA